MLPSTALSIGLASALASLVTLLVKRALMDRLGDDVLSGDANFHLLYADDIRAAGHSFRGVRPRFFLLGDRHTYPWAFHWVFSFVPKARLEAIQAYVPVAVKCLVVLFVSLVTGVVAAGTDAGEPMAAWAACMAGLVYGLSPINQNLSHTNLSDFAFTPRATGVLLSSVAWYAVCDYAATSRSGSAVVAAIATSAALLTSKFATQSLVLPGVCFTAITGSFAAVVVLCAGFAVGLVITRGAYWDVVMGHIRHSCLYRARIAREHPAAQTRSFVNLDGLRLVWYLCRGRWSEFRRVLRSNFVLRGLTLYPIHGVAALVVAVHWGTLQQSPMLSYLTALWASVWIVTLATSLPGLTFLGESDRYLEFVGFLPATALAVPLLARGPHAWAACTALPLVYMAWCRVLSDLLPATPQRITPDQRELWERLSALAGERARVLAIPVNAAFEYAYRAGIECAFFPANMTSAGYAEAIDHYPVPRLDFSYFVQRHGVTHVVVHKWYMRDECVAAAVTECPTVFENATYAIRSLPRSPSTE